MQQAATVLQQRRARAHYRETDVDAESRGSTVGRPVAVVDERALTDLGRQIKYRREDLLKMSLRELGRRVGVTASYLAVIEDGQSGKRRTKPDRELIIRLSDALGIREVTDWLALAGYPDIYNQWGAVESAFYQTELVRGDPIKPGSRLRVERMEDQLAEVVFCTEGPVNREVVLAEVPVFSYLSYLARNQHNPKLLVVGVGLRSGERPGVFARLKGSHDPSNLREVSTLAGRSVATIGLLTESLIYLLASLDRANVPWQVRSIPKKSRPRDGDDGLFEVCRRGAADDKRSVRISVSYNSGSLVDDLRRGVVQYSLVPPSPFEVWKLESERWCISETEHERITDLLGFDFIPGYPDYPSSLLVAAAEDLRLTNNDRKKYKDYITDEVAGIGRENDSMLNRWRVNNSLDSPREEMFKIRDPKPDVLSQLSDTGFIVNESGVTKDLNEMYSVARSVLGEGAYRDLFPAMDEDVINMGIVSRQELLGLAR